MDPSTLDACLRRWAASTPRAVAVARVTDDECVDTLTWRALSRRAHILARAVRDCPNGRALSACRDGIAAVVALHGVALAGRSCVPVDVDAWPTARWAAAAKNVGATTCVCATERDAARMRSVFGEESVRVILVSDDVDANEDEDEDDDEFPRSSASATELYAAHTSGSTGAPKCAPTTHGRAMMYARAKCRVERITRDSRVCLASNATFDPHAGDLCAAALVGAACVVASRAMIQRDFAAVLRLGRVTHVCCTPTVFSLARCPRGAKDAPTLRCVTLIGEKTSSETLRLWADDVELYNAYGATETTVVQTYARMRRDDDPRRAGTPYGEDLGFAWVAVAEDEDATTTTTTAIRFATARRVVGEIIIGGACVSEGYVGAGASTAGPSPFVSTSRGFAYRTGDRGYLDDAGDLFLLGRVDRQVKIRGHRIELDEIELAARAERGLVDDVAVTLEDDETLVAYHRAAPTFWPRRDGALVVYALERALARALPRVMIPRRHVFVARDAWPMTTSGKTNRRELSSRLASGAVEAFRPERVDPRPGLERVVADAWAKALGARLDDVSAEDSFEALGGSSLNVVAASRALAEDARLSRPAANRAAANDEARGLGEAAALLPTTDELAACASFPGAFTDGPFAPCEILAKPTVREYAAFLAASGVTFTGAVETERVEDDENDDPDDRYAMEACGRGVLAVARSLFDGGVTPRGRHLRAAAAASLSDDADAVVRELIARGVDVSEPSPAGTLATHLAAARGRAETLRALLDAGAPPGAKDADKQTILHLAARSGDVETVRVAADAVKHLQTRRGGLEAWDRWKRTAAAWALREGSGDALRALRDAGAKLSALEREASRKTHGELSAKSEVQWAHRPTRKREASVEVMEALSRALDGTRVEDEKNEEDARRAASALRDLVCANAANRETSRALGIIPKLCARVRERHCVDAIGALRNIAASAASAVEARASGALGALADVVRARAKTAAITPLAGEDKRLVFAAASAIRAIAVKDATSAAIVSRDARDVAAFVLAECDVDLFADAAESER